MRKNSKTAVKHEMEKRLHDLYHQGRGSSKRESKANHQGVSPYIHSRTTLQTYLQQAGQYGDWLQKNHPDCTTMAGAAGHVQEYIDAGAASGWSAWTQQTARAAIGKALGVKPTELASCEKRHAKDITRGRTETKKAAQAAARNAADLKICECVGVRHNREAGQVTAANCHWAGGHIASVSLVGKGGRPREAAVLAGAGRDELERRAKAASAAGEANKPLLGSMSGCNVHGARAKYAAGLYQQALATGKASGQMYTPRGSGKSYDKGALDYVNENLGHGAGRYDVAVHNYLAYGEKSS